MKISSQISFRVSKIIQKHPFVKDILYSIAQQGGKVLLVGGAVRDIFLDNPIQDIDFEVYGLTFEQLQQVLEQFGTVSCMGASFGVLRVHGYDIDWSLPRADSAGRHPIVAYDPAMSYAQAFARRDLTINAMGIEMDTLELIDLYGGMDDLHNKVLRATDIHFFAQDPLRLLRVMQFAARFSMKVDPKLSALCAGMDITNLSKERCEQELSKLFLQSTTPSIGLQWLVHIQKFEQLLPGIVIDQLLWSKLNCAARCKFANPQEKLAMLWAVLISCGVKDAMPLHCKKLEQSELQPFMYCMSVVSRHDHLIKKVAKLVGYGKIAAQGLTDVQCKWLAYWLAPELSLRKVAQLLLLTKRADAGTALADQAAGCSVLDAPEPPLLTGKDFIAAAQGPQIGTLVHAAYQLQIDETIYDRQILFTRVMQ